MRLPFLTRRDAQAAVRRAARDLAKAGIDRRRALIRATTDDIRARLGMPPANWPTT